MVQDMRMLWAIGMSRLAKSLCQTGWWRATSTALARLKAGRHPVKKQHLAVARLLDGVGSRALSAHWAERGQRATAAANRMSMVLDTAYHKRVGAALGSLAAAVLLAHGTSI